MKIYVIKYALTEGILEAEANPDDVVKGLVTTRIEGTAFSTSYFHAREYCTSREDAVVRAEEMRKRKIKSLEKSLEKLKALKFAGG